MGSGYCSTSNHWMLLRCPLPCFTLQWGRVDVTDCSTSEPALPSPTMTGDAMFDYFKSGFGFSRSQVHIQEYNPSREIFLDDFENSLT